MTDTVLILSFLLGYYMNLCDMNCIVPWSKCWQAQLKYITHYKKIQTIKISNKVHKPAIQNEIELCPRRALGAQTLSIAINFSS